MGRKLWAVGKGIACAGKSLPLNQELPGKAAALAQLRQPDRTCRHATHSMRPTYLLARKHRRRELPQVAHRFHGLVT